MKALIQHRVARVAIRVVPEVVAEVVPRVVAEVVAKVAIDRAAADRDRLHGGLGGQLGGTR